MEIQPVGLHALYDASILGWGTKQADRRSISHELHYGFWGRGKYLGRRSDNEAPLPFLDCDGLKTLL